MSKLVFLLAFVASTMAADMDTMVSTPVPPMMPSPLPPMGQQLFVSGSNPFIPNSNLMSNFSSPALSTGYSGSGTSYIPPGYGIQQVFYPPPIFNPGMGSYGSSYPYAPSPVPPMNQNPQLLGLQGHAAPVHQVPWYPTPASTCQGCNLIYRGLPYPGLVPNVQQFQHVPNVQLQTVPNVPYVRSVPLSPFVNNWVPHNVQPVLEPVVQNVPVQDAQPNLYNPEPIPSPIPVPSVVPVVPESSVPVVPESSVPVVPESVPVVSPKEVVESEVPASRKKRALVYSRYGSYGYRSYYGGWPNYGYRSYYGGWPNYGSRSYYGGSYYPYRSWSYPYW